VSAGNSDAVVASFDPGCTLQWSARYGDAAMQWSRALDRRPTGELIAAGYFEGTIDFGLGPHVATGISTFVAELDPAGVALWSESSTGLVAFASSVAFTPSGMVVIAGCFGGSINLGGPTLVTAGGTDFFVVMLDATGAHVWSKRFGDSAGQCTDWTQSVAVDPAGNVVLAGSFKGTVDFGGGPLDTFGDFDVFVAKFDPAGNHLWSKQFGSMFHDDEARGLASTPSGEIVITGSYVAPLDFGGGPLAHAGTGDIFLVTLAPNGDHVWSQGFGTTSTQRGFDVAVDGSGNVLLSGFLGGPFDFGDGPKSGGAFVAKFDATGQHLWNQQFGVSGYQEGNALAVDGDGNVIAVGRFDGTIDFGAGPATNGGFPDAFLVKLSP
jgi:hypothetical protein